MHRFALWSLKPAAVEFARCFQAKSTYLPKLTGKPSRQGQVVQQFTLSASSMLLERISPQHRKANQHYTISKAITGSEAKTLPKLPTLFISGAWNGNGSSWEWNHIFTPLIVILVEVMRILKVYNFFQKHLWKTLGSCSSYNFHSNEFCWWHAYFIYPQKI